MVEKGHHGKDDKRLGAVHEAALGSHYNGNSRYRGRIHVIR